MVSLQPGCTVRTTCGQLRTSWATQDRPPVGNSGPRMFTWGALASSLPTPPPLPADTLTPVERTNWALSAWNSTLDWNGVPSAWLYGQDHLWATQDLVGNSGPTTCGQLRTSYVHLGSFGLLPPHPPTPSRLPPTHPLVNLG